MPSLLASDRGCGCIFLNFLQVHVAGSLLMFHRAHQLAEIRPVESEL